MARYEWGNLSVGAFSAQVEREKVELERLKEVERKRHADRLGDLDEDQKDIADKEGMLARHWQAQAEKKKQRAAGADASPLHDVGYSVFGLTLRSLKGLKDTKLADLEIADFGERKLKALADQLVKLDLEDAVTAVFAAACPTLSPEQALIARPTVNDDVSYCRHIVEKALGEGARQQNQAIAQIRRHFETPAGPGPSFGLDEQKWREVTAEWARNWNVPERAILIVPAGYCKSDAPLLTISSGRLLVEDNDRQTGRQISPAVELDHRLRQAAGMAMSGDPIKRVDPMKKLLEPHRHHVGKCEGTPKEARARRDLEHMESILPLLLAPSLIYQAKRQRDHFCGRLLGQRGPSDKSLIHAPKTREILGALAHPRFSALTFGEKELADLPIRKLEAVLESGGVDMAASSRENADG